MLIKKYKRVLVFLYVFACLSGNIWGRPSILSPNLNLFSIVKYYIENAYVEKDLNYTNLEYGAIKGYLKALDDPYTRFMEPKSTEEMNVRLNGAFFGIGIHIGIKKDQLTVISAIPDTPAAIAGIKALDKIVSIDSKATTGISLTDAVSRIRGEKGTTVVLGIKREFITDVLNIPIIRDKIQIKAVNKMEVFKEKVGYIKLATFENKNATNEVAAAIKKLQMRNIKSLILDLRYNGGGLLQNAIDIASLFLPSGIVVKTLDRNQIPTVEQASGHPLYDENKPLLLLVNKSSASASEILAGAIKDHKRGLLVGEKTFGKASVQRILNLPDGSSVLYTTARYYTPNGTNISHKGISVNMEIKIPTADMQKMKEPDYIYTYETDVQLQKAIELSLKQINGSLNLSY
jgi:carboxyl-terminal processing protease